MFKKIIFISLIFLACVCVKAQTLAGYEYWVDDEYTGRTTATVSDEELNLSVDVSNMTPGIHFYNFRSKNAEGKWSAPNRYIFYIPDNPAADTKVTRYESWIDDDFSSCQHIDADGGDYQFNVDVSNLSEGIHFCTFRVLNSAGEYSAPYRYIFYIPAAESDDAILSGIEYWIDNDYEHRANRRGTQASYTMLLDASKIEPGIHTFSVRVFADDGTTSSPKTLLFYVTEQKDVLDSKIVGYRYNFNDIDHYVSIEPTDAFDMSGISFELPSIEDVATIGDNCKFTFSNTEVKMERKTDVSFALQFVNELGSWSAPVGYKYVEDDVISKTPKALTTTLSVYHDAFGRNDFEPLLISAPSTGTYYIYSSSQCVLYLYNSNGKLVATMTPDMLQEIYSMDLITGSYYGILHSASGADAGRVQLSTNYEDITTDVSKVRFDVSENSSVDIYSLDGILYSIVNTANLNATLHSLPKGIYVINGKKYAVIK